MPPHCRFCLVGLVLFVLNSMQTFSLERAEMQAALAGTWQDSLCPSVTFP